MFVTDFVSLIETIEHTTHHVTFNEVSNLTGIVTLFGIAALLLFGLFVLELYAVISAAVKASKGESYKYPLSIPFIKTTNPVLAGTNQQENEHTS